MTDEMRAAEPDPPPGATLRLTDGGRPGQRKLEVLVDGEPIARLPYWSGYRVNAGDVAAGGVGVVSVDFASFGVELHLIDSRLKDQSGG